MIALEPADIVTPPVPGDTLRVEVESYELRGYKNGALVMVVTDSDPTRIGQPEHAGRAERLGGVVRRQQVTPAVLRSAA